VLSLGRTGPEFRGQFFFGTNMHCVVIIV
jgi:hypothetical protein